MVTRLVGADNVTGKLPDVVLTYLRSNLGVSGSLVYANGAYPERPTTLPAGGASYVGPVEPTTWLPGDEWRDIS